MARVSFPPSLSTPSLQRGDLCSEMATQTPSLAPSGLCSVGRNVLKWGGTRDVGSSFEIVCYSLLQKRILQQQEMWIIMWIQIKWTILQGFIHFSIGQIKTDILKWKWQTLEAFLNLEYTTGQENSQRRLHLNLSNRKPLFTFYIAFIHLKKTFSPTDAGLTRNTNMLGEGACSSSHLDELIYQRLVKPRPPTPHLRL